MAYLYNNIIIFGFRATGKSTISKNLAIKLGWKLIEMDEEIVKRAGKPVQEITQNGTDWQEFRELESRILLEVLDQPYVVISAGGGVGVNNHINKKTNESFGELQKRLIKKAIHSLKVVLYASDETISQRIKEQEMKKDSIQRPLLNEKTAQELQQKLRSVTNTLEQKEIIINALVKDSLEMYRIREPLYTELGKITVDTGNTSIDGAVTEIYNKVIRSL